MKITDTTAPGDMRTITLPGGAQRKVCVTHVIHDGDDVYVGTLSCADFPCPECGRKECPKAWDVRNTCGDGDDPPEFGTHQREGWDPLDMRRRGLFFETTPVPSTTLQRIRLTIPVIEQLRAAGSQVYGNPDGSYRVEIGPRIPKGLVVVNLLGNPSLGVRGDNEPTFPGEFAVGSSWVQLDLTPCPKCESPMLPNEARSIPGYRICTGYRHHHYLFVGKYGHAIE